MVKVSTGLSVSASNYKEYRLYYNATHRNVWGRRLHAAGTVVSLLCALISLIRLDLQPLIAGLLAGYGVAWSGDLLLESRKPASLEHPVWALRAHAEMMRDMATGKQSSLIH